MNKKNSREYPVVVSNRDLELKCQDCHSMFVFTIGEQQFFEKRRFTLPRRCPECRKAKKARADSGFRH